MDSTRNEPILVLAPAGGPVAPDFKPLRSRRLLVRAQRSPTQRPQGASGCLSELSIPIVLDHEYFAALKDFATSAAEYQAYLGQLGAQHTSVYAADAGIDDHALHDPLEPPEAIAVGVSDDDIEGCGYLGWLRH